jgi:hypothetical protein
MSINPVIDAPASFVPRMAVSFGASGDVATAVDGAHPMPVGPRGVPVGYLDRSGAIAAGGAPQTIAAANPARQGFLVQNLSAADLWFSSLGAATAGSPALRIAPGQLYESPAHGVPSTAISILGATTGQAFAAREW